MRLGASRLDGEGRKTRLQVRFCGRKGEVDPQQAIMNTIVSILIAGGFILFLLFAAALWTHFDSNRKQPKGTSQNPSKGKDTN